MKSSFPCTFSIFLGWLACALSEITVLKIVQIIYDKSPKLRIRGSGFDADSHDIVLEISASGQLSLKVDKDFLISKDADGDGLILKLLGNRKWVDLDGRVPPMALTLSAVRFGVDSTKNLLAEPIIVAQVLSTPSVSDGNDIIYSSATNELRINGTGFMGAKKVDLYFQPPLIKEVAYEDVTKYPLIRDQVVLRLRHNYNWRDDSGPLTVVGIDTGGGPVKLNGDDGVKVADVQPNLDTYAVTVRSTADEQLIYNDQMNLIISVTVLKVVQIIYDKSPQLRIRGSGFDADDHDIILEISASGQPSLKVDKDFLISKDADGDGLILKLLGNRKWVDLDDRAPPVALILSAVKFGADSTKNLLVEPVIVAQVLRTPSVREGNDVVYSSATNELRINGVGFMGAKKVDLYFQHGLMKWWVAYDDVTKYPLVRDQVVLRLRHNYNWRDDAGPLTVVGIDTGGGPVKLNGDDGVKVADVQPNLEAHAMTVRSTADEQLVYNDQTNLIISGTGFNTIGNTLRFANGILGNNVNYTTLTTSDDRIALKLVPGSFWRKSNENLPGALTLLAVNAGEGFVAVDPIKAGKGRDVAVVFERPNVFADNKKLYRTRSHELHIKGRGFVAMHTNSGYTTRLKFAPPLVLDLDYTIGVVDRTELEITLVYGRAWRADAGPLNLVAINTLGDEAGWVVLPGDGVHLAEVQEDIHGDARSGKNVEVFPSEMMVFQSQLNQVIMITGIDFIEGMSFTLEPDLREGVDYDMEVVSRNLVNLRLKTGKKWRIDPGFIFAKSIRVGEKVFNLAAEEGVRIATVLADPVDFRDSR